MPPPITSAFTAFKITDATAAVKACERAGGLVASMQHVVESMRFGIAEGQNSLGFLALAILA